MGVIAAGAALARSFPPPSMDRPADRRRSLGPGHVGRLSRLSPATLLRTGRALHGEHTRSRGTTRSGRGMAPDTGGSRGARNPRGAPDAVPLTHSLHARHT